MKSKAAARFLAVLTTLVYLFLWAPAIVLIIFSFSKHRLGIRWEGFTLKWYVNLFGNAALGDAVIRSIIIALITVVVSVVAGTFTAYGLYKHKFLGRRVLRTTILIPIVMPYVVTGASLLVFFVRVIHIPLGFVSVIIAHITFSIPLAVFVVLGRMQRIDWTLEEASMDLGANRTITLRRITLPLLMPSILASAALIFPWSFDDFVVTYFVAGVGVTTLPIYVFSQVRFGATSTINSIGTIFIAFTIACLVLMNFLQKKKTI